MKDISQYAVNIPVMEYYPSQLNPKELDGIMEMLGEDISQCTTCIVESHTFSTALWGELLSQRVNGKHFIFLLHEGERHVTKSMFDFLKFKLERGEIVGINAKSLQQIKCNRTSLTDSSELYLNAVCGNSVEDIIMEKSIWNFNRETLNIGVIGRLEKPYVEKAINSILNYSSQRKIKTEIILIGGSAQDGMIDYLTSKRNQYVNIYCTGFIYPIPLSLLKQMQFVIVGSGSVKGPSSNGILTISMDMKGVPIGIYGIDTYDTQYNSSNNTSDMEYYIDKIVSGEYTSDCITIESRKKEDDISIQFKMHMDYINDSTSVVKYYPVSRVDNGLLRRSICRIMGILAYKELAKRVKALYKT